MKGGRKMHDHLEKAVPVLPITLSGKEEPKEAKKELSDEEITKCFEKCTNLLSKDVYEQVVNIIGESVFDLQKEGILATLEESATDILKSKKEKMK
jgi:hypothetical protein